MIGTSIRTNDSKTWEIPTTGVRASMEVKAAMIAARTEQLTVSFTTLRITKKTQSGRTDPREETFRKIIRMIKEISRMGSLTKLHQNLYLSIPSLQRQLLYQRLTKSWKSST